jgi:hypothetical protein
MDISSTESVLMNHVQGTGIDRCLFISLTVRRQSYVYLSRDITNGRSIVQRVLSNF